MSKKWIIISLIVVIILISSKTAIGRSEEVSDITGELPWAGTYGSRNLEEIRNIVIHHSASTGQTPYDYARFHISKGWPGIGYHFVIDPSGKIWQTNALQTASYHVKNNNTPSVGICLSGDLNKDPMTAQQKKALKGLIRRLKKSLPGPLSVGAHRDFVNTDCPGVHTHIQDFQ